MRAEEDARMWIARVLGIDPGMAVMGYGLVEVIDDRLTVIDYGALSTSSQDFTSLVIVSGGS